MKSRFVSFLPLVVLSVGCGDDGGTSSSPVDAGSDRDGAVATSPASDAGEPAPSNSGTVNSNDNLTLGIDDSADELTIVEEWPTKGVDDAGTSEASASDARTSADETSTLSAPSSSVDVVTSAPSETSSHDETTIETDVVTLVLDTESDAGISVGPETDTVGELDASTTSTETDASSEAETDSGVGSLLLEGCTLVAGERPATTPTANAPLVAGLDLGPGVAGEALSGSVQFQDSNDDATTLIVQVGTASEHYLCTLTSESLEQGSVELGLLSLGSTFPNGGYTLYVGVADGAGNVSGYIAGSLTVGVSSAQAVCGAEPRLLIGAVPSQDTSFYAQQNGFSPDYNAGEPLAIVASTDLFLRMDECTELLMAGDALGQTPIGWDNCLLVEYRPSPEAAREAVWSYCSLPIFDTAANAQVPMAEEAPTVPGTALNPPVPNSAAFGWPALSLDLMRYVPEDHPNEFVLNLRLLDFGSVGSTTDVWVTAQTTPTF